RGHAQGRGEGGDQPYVPAFAGRRRASRARGAADDRPDGAAAVTAQGAMSSGLLEFALDGKECIAADFDRVVIGGWTGRDRQAVARYVDGLVEKGFARPSRLPCYYGVSPALLTQAETIDVLGEGTS